MKIHSKEASGQKPYKPPSPKCDQCYMSLASLLRAITFQINKAETQEGKLAIQRKIRALALHGINPFPLLAMNMADLYACV